MVHIIENPIGKVLTVPAGLKARCETCYLELETDGTESAAAHEAQSFNGKFLYGSGLIGFYLPCPDPGCGNRFVSFVSNISIRKWRP